MGLPWLACPVGWLGDASGASGALYSKLNSTGRFPPPTGFSLSPQQLLLECRWLMIQWSKVPRYRIASICIRNRSRHTNTSTRKPRKRSHAWVPPEFKFIDGYMEDDSVPACAVPAAATASWEEGVILVSSATGETLDFFAVIISAAFFTKCKGSFDCVVVLLMAVICVFCFVVHQEQPECKKRTFYL